MISSAWIGLNHNFENPNKKNRPYVQHVVQEEEGGAIQHALAAVEVSIPHKIQGFKQKSVNSYFIFK